MNTHAKPHEAQAVLDQHATADEMARNSVNAQAATPSPTPAAKKKRASVYSVTIKVDMPLDMKNAGTLVTAMETYEKAILPSAWPEGSVIESTADIKKVAG